MTRSADGTTWQIIPDFDATSRFDICSVTGRRKRDEDVGVFRPMIGMIDYEGFFDICQYGAEQLAQLLGWSSPEQVEELKNRINDLETEIETVRKDAFKRAENAVRMAGVRASKEETS